MKKILLFTILALVLVITGIFIFLSKRSGTTNQSTTSQQATPTLPGETAAPSSGAKPINSEEEKITVKAKVGNVTVNNFEKNAEIATSGVIYFVDKKEYNICYNPTSGEFIVTLLVNQAIESTRIEAEKDLLNSLGISQQDACNNLRVYLYVSAAINESLSNNHGLSFCPGSKKFPN